MGVFQHAVEIMRTGTAHLPLHTGKAPAWLFQRMKLLAREISLFVIDAFGKEEMLARLSDPYWFQAFGCVLGFDWHSSGVTTTVCGALKEGLKGVDREVGFFVTGGKGRVSRRTPLEIEEICQRLSIDGAPLIYASRMSAKVDSAAVQDGYQIYHHCLFFTDRGSWGVVQQGMNGETRYARRYHWIGEGVQDFVCEPHAAVCCDTTGEGLNLVARESGGTRGALAKLSHLAPEVVLREGKKINELCLPGNHAVPMEKIQLARFEKQFLDIYNRSPENFEQLLGTPGLGPKGLRALTFISELVFGEKPSFKDPTRFSFTHGGKDGHPYPVDRKVYDQTVHVLTSALDRARVGDREKIDAIRRLRSFTGPAR
jgi:uncharacterized protein